jgi:hypothetical protein
MVRGVSAKNLFIACLLALLALGLRPSTVRAYTFLDSFYGTPTGTAMGRSVGMAATGVSLFQSGQALAQNPAVLMLDSGRFRFDLQVGLLQASEDRLIPLFDSFDSFVRDTGIASNRNGYGDVVGSIQGRLPVERPMSLGAGIFDRFNFDYDYFEEFRNPSGFPPNPGEPARDQILETRTIAQDGRIRSLSVGYGAEIVGPARIGISLNRYFGKITTRTTVVDWLRGAKTQENLIRDLTGWGWTVGGQGRVTQRLAVGISLEGPFTMEGPYTYDFVDEGASFDTMFVSNEKIDYPAALRFGFTYYPRASVATTFSADFVRRFWKDLDDTFAQRLRETLPPDFSQDSYLVKLAAVNPGDTWDMRLGLEHTFYSKLPVRFGFRYLGNYSDEESQRSIFSAGLGYRIQEFQLDVTGAYHRQTSRQPFLFNQNYVAPDGSVFPAPDTDTKVEDSLLQVVFTVSRSF